jgi:hypothetical protein
MQDINSELQVDRYGFGITYRMGPENFGVFSLSGRISAGAGPGAGMSSPLRSRL